MFSHLEGGCGSAESVFSEVRMEDRVTLFGGRQSFSVNKVISTINTSSMSCAICLFPQQYLHLDRHRERSSEAATEADNAEVYVIPLVSIFCVFAAVIVASDVPKILRHIRHGADRRSDYLRAKAIEERVRRHAWGLKD